MERTSDNTDEWTMEVYQGETKLSSFKGQRTLEQILRGVRDYLLKQKHERV